MNILIVAATFFEVYDFKSYIENNHEYYLEKQWYIDFLITGVGTVATTFSLTQYLLQHNVDYVIQMGIAGSFRNGIKILDIVRVESEAFGDTGVESPNGNMDLFDINLLGVMEKPYENKLIFDTEEQPLAIFNNLKKVHGLTVNMGSGIQETIEYRRKKFAADVESMEGAALHYVCAQLNKPFIQIRCISNYVEPRNTENWKLKESIKRLNEFMIQAFE